jgi:predicted PurR-regulated permease PerM
LVALAGRGPVIALVVLVMIVLVGQFEGNVLHPLVMARAVNLHPVVIALSVASGAVLGGIIGAVIAVPLVSTIWGVTKYLRAHPA